MKTSNKICFCLEYLLFVTFPVKHNDVWSLYKKSVDCFRKAEDIDLSRDYVDWMRLISDEKYFIKMVHRVMVLSLKI